MENKIVTSVTRRAGLPISIVELMGAMESSDLQTLMTHVYEQVAHGSTPADIVHARMQSRFTDTCDVPQRELLELDRVIYGVIPDDFFSLELSPVVPIGINSVLTSVNQKRVLPTIRNVEVLGDPTTALALECALRRRKLLHQDPKDATTIKVCTSQRSVRLQHYEANSGFTPHFRAFALATAGRDCGHEKFERDNLFEHISFYLKALRSLNVSGYPVMGMRVVLSDIRITDTLIQRYVIDRGLLARNPHDVFRQYGVQISPGFPSVAQIPEQFIEENNIWKPIELLAIIEESVVRNLRLAFPGVDFVFDTTRVSGMGYYKDVCFDIRALNSAGQWLSLCDGGTASWTAKMVASSKERLIVSGFGSELFCKLFRA